MSIAAGFKYRFRNSMRGALLMNAGINMTEIAPWAYSSAKLHFIAK